MVSSEELLDLINGIAGAICTQHQSSKKNSLLTHKFKPRIYQTCCRLIYLHVFSASPSASTLYLHPLSLPEFTGGEILDPFLDQLSQVLSSSNVDPQFWIPYLKHQCQKDSYASDIILSFEKQHRAEISNKTTTGEFLKLYDACLQTLRNQHSIPVDQQIPTLLATYYLTWQNPSKSVWNFAHRFLETQNLLQKLIPGLHSSCNGNQMELVHTFSMSLCPELAKSLISREKPFKNLLAAIDCAKRHIIQAYHNSPSGMHHGHDASYNAISHDFYWCNLSKHMCNWVHRCNHCIQFKSLSQPHGPMQIRLYHHPIHTLGIDFVGELPASSLGNKWILTTVYHFSNFLRAIPVPNKTATTTTRALLHEILLPLAFPTVLQSDRGSDFLDAVMHRLTSLLSIQHVFTSRFRPCQKVPLNMSIIF